MTRGFTLLILVSTAVVMLLVGIGIGQWIATNRTSVIPDSTSQQLDQQTAQSTPPSDPVLSVPYTMQDYCLTTPFAVAMAKNVGAPRSDDQLQQMHHYMTAFLMQNYPQYATLTNEETLNNRMEGYCNSTATEQESQPLSYFIPKVIQEIQQDQQK